MIYYISDLHLGHRKVLEYDKRQFESVEQMEETIIRNWNGRVSDKDTVYVLGDAFFWGTEKSLAIMRRLKGHKRLIRGNHDRTRGRLNDEWESVSEYEEITDGGRSVVMSHYPMMFYNNQHSGAVMLYGHVHNSREWELLEKWKIELAQLGIPADIINVGCMLRYMDYTPRTLDELLAADTSP